MGSLALIVTSIENEIPHFLLLVQQNFIGQFNYREYYLWKKDALYVIITEIPYKVGDLCKPKGLITLNKYVNLILQWDLF